MGTTSVPIPPDAPTRPSVWPDVIVQDQGSKIGYLDFTPPCDRARGRPHCTEPAKYIIRIKKLCLCQNVYFACQLCFDICVSRQHMQTYCKICNKPIPDYTFTWEPIAK